MLFTVNVRIINQFHYLHARLRISNDCELVKKI